MAKRVTLAEREKNRATEVTKEITGYECGLKAMDNRIKMTFGRIGICQAEANNGKTTFLWDYARRMYKMHGFKTALIDFESDEIIRDKVTDLDATEVFEEVENREDLIQAIEEAHQCGCKIVVIDPFTYIQDFWGKVDTYSINTGLKELKRLAKKFKLLIILAVHPRKLSEGEELSIHTPSGSANFGNVADYFFSIRLLDGDVTEITVQKLRYRWKGLKTEAGAFKYNYDKNIFEDKEEENLDGFESAEVKDKFDAERERRKGLKASTTTSEANSQSVVGGEIMQTEVSLYKKCAYDKNTMIPLEEALALDKEHLDTINEAQTRLANGDEKGYKKIKDTLPAFTPSGTFDGAHSMEKLKHYNGIICLDFDKFKNEEKLEEAREKIQAKPFVFYCAKSLSGRGLFALVRVDGDSKDHEAHFEALKEEFAEIEEFDKVTKDITRLRIISHDPNPYKNLNAVVYTKKVEKTKSDLLVDYIDRPLTDEEKKEAVRSVEELIEACRYYNVKPTNNHEQTNYIMCVLRNKLGDDGRRYVHIMRSMREGYDADKKSEIDKRYDATLEKETYGEVEGLWKMKMDELKANGYKPCSGNVDYGLQKEILKNVNEL